MAKHRPTTLIAFICILMIFASVFAHKEKTSIKKGKHEQAIIEVLNDFHDAAARADEKRYMAHLAEDAVFMGTDAEERWTKGEFQQYVHSFFSKGRGWTYVGKKRLIGFMKSGKMAWFSERLFNETYGELRGSGVLANVNGRWKIFQYNMVFVVPNGVAGKVVEQIRQFQKAQQKAPSTQP